MLDGARVKRENGAIQRERLIDQICDSFESALKAGERPEIAPYLRRAPIDAQRVLLEELLRTAIDYAGTSPNHETSRVCSRSDRNHGEPSARLVNEPLNGKLPFDTKQQSLSDTPEVGVSPTPTDLELSIPREFGDFEILTFVGRGGMGTVFSARQRSLNRIVALKVLNAQFGSSQIPGADDEGVFRFQRESTAAARQDHENIVTIFDSGEFGGKHYVAMQFIVGSSLRDMTADGPLSNFRAARYLLPVCRAVHRMHSLGVVHRDLKPSNILVDSELDKPYVADFGLAKLLDERAEMTLSGEMFGSLPYMPPEQVVNARDVGPGADVYGLGATLYHLLTGRPPFQAASMPETIGQIAARLPIAPRQFNPSIHPDLETICLKCLEKEASRRYESANLLADDLARFLEDRPILARPPAAIERLWRWSRRNRLIAVCLATVLLSLLAIAFGSGLMYVRETSLRQNVTIANDATRLQLSNLYVTNAALDNTARLGWGLAWLAGTIDLDQSNPERLKLDEQRIKSALASYPHLVQLGWHDQALRHIDVDRQGKRFLVAGADEYITVWNADSTEPYRRLWGAGQWTAVAISPDGLYAAATCNNGRIQAWDIEAGAAIDNSWLCDDTDAQLRFSPDSRFVVTNGAGGRVRFWNIESPHAPPNIEMEHLLNVTSFDFNQTGSLLVTGCRDGNVRVWNTSNGALLHGPVKHGDTIRKVCISATGDRLISIGVDSTILLWHTSQALPQRTALVHRSFVADAQFLSDGGQVLTATTDGRLQLWSAPDGAPVGPEMQEEAGIRGIRICSDDATALAICKNNTVHAWNLRSFQAIAPPIVHAQTVQDAQFIANKTIVTASEDGCFRAWRMPSTQSLIKPARSLRVDQYATSPDGLRIAIRQKNQQVCVMDARNGELAELDSPRHSLASTLAWRPDGLRLMVGNIDGSCRTWDHASGQVTTSPLRLRATVTALGCSDDGRYVAAGAKDGSVAVFDSASSRVAEYKAATESAISSIAFGPGNRHVSATCGRDVFVWRISDSLADRAKPTRLPHETLVIFSHFLTDRHAVLSASREGRCYLWDAATGTQLQQFKTPAKRLDGALLSNDGALFATFGADRCIRVWDARKGLQAKNLLPLGATVLDTRISTTNIISVLFDNGSIASWDLMTGEALGPSIQMGVPGIGFAGSPTTASNRVLTSDGTLVQVHHLLHDLPTEDLSHWCRLVTGHCVDPHDGIVALSADETRKLWTSISGRRD